MSFNFLSFLRSCPGAVAQGIIWGIMAVGVYLTYKVLDYADLTVDNSLCTGGAVCAMLITSGSSPVLAMLCAVIAGFAAGLVTGLLHTKLRIPAILAGILTQLALYSINMRIMGRANVSLLKVDTVITISNIPHAILIGAILAAALIVILYFFFGTETGCAIRATGSNPDMARSLGVNTDTMKVLTLMISNGLVALSGSLIAQYQGFSDINMGRGAIVIGLASVIIGEVLIGKNRNFAVKLLSTVIGSIVYYLIITIVLQAGLATTDLKLFSAIVVAIALGIPSVREQLSQKPKKEKGGEN